MGDDGGECEEREENQAMKYRTTALLANPSVSSERISRSRLTISDWKETEVKIKFIMCCRLLKTVYLQFLFLSLSLKVL